ncbi:hypothetical protein ABZP36_000838 [Zizania latifolia]
MAKHQQWPLLLAAVAIILLLSGVPASVKRQPHPSVPPGRHFGDTTMMDDLLTEGPSREFKVVGRAQGTYMLTNLRDAVQVVTITALLELVTSVSAIHGRRDRPAPAGLRVRAVEDGEGDVAGVLGAGAGRARVHARCCSYPLAVTSSASPKYCALCW